MKNAFIIHGTEGYPEENWFPWLKEKLEANNYKVFIPQFPTPKNQDPEHWFEVFNEYEKYLDNETIIVAHSGGCAFLLRLLEKIKIKINIAVFVAPPVGVMPIKYIKADWPFIKDPIDWKKIKSNSNNFLVFHSVDDPFICIENGEKVAEELGTNLIRLEDAGHFNKKSGYLKFDLLLEKLKPNL
ncbi:serine hydrolase family protein [archaeon]|jgi:uncharacterized protein|nr:serine hydrolase family protein [archaeon]MBT4646672.1 serine hydrolase family protein [archaeon]MBT6821878.1 serine hydrolase family protein [archaeon]MBT7392288.1 serine hydrolase family protein [archaeon]